MNILKNTLLLSVLVCGTSLVSSVNAGDLDISYKYLEIGYSSLDVDDVLPGVDVDGDGWGFKTSMPVHPNVHLFAGYSELDFDFDVDVTTWEAGIGYNYTVADKTSLFATVAYVDGEAESGGISVDDNGYALGAGVRYMLITDGIRASVLDGIEFQGSVDYVDFDEVGDDTSFSGGVLFHFNRVVAIGIGGTWGSDVSGYTIGLRMNY